MISEGETDLGFGLGAEVTALARAAPVFLLAHVTRLTLEVVQTDNDASHYIVLPGNGL